MWFDKTQEEDIKEAYNGYSEVFYSSRSHQDNTKQICKHCGNVTTFLFDRCELCKSNN